MKEKHKKLLKNCLFGLFTGLVNGTFGAGGGMVAVPVLKSTGMKQDTAQQNAVAVILPITLLSAGIYLFKGYVKITDALPFIPTGLLGALSGTYLIKKISPLYLKIIFGAFMVYAGIRTVLK